MSEQDGRQASTLQRPTTSDPEAWKAYWKAQGQPWRTEPEIDAERQKYLAERRSIKPVITKGIYPFGDIKLSRADVEWLLATHEDGRGPVDWNDESQRERQGLDLCGADLSQEDLTYFPLACMRSGLTEGEWFGATEEQKNMAAVRMQGADLRGAQLQGAELRGAQLQGADLRGAQLQGADLSGAQLQGADLRGAQLQGAELDGAQLQKAILRGAQLQKAELDGAQLQYANLRGAQLQYAELGGAQLQKAILRGAQLQRAELHRAQLQGADFRGAELDGVQLYGATLSDEKYGTVLLADIRWGEINLAVVDWTPVKMLGEEHLAHKTKEIDDYRVAVRANRQLAAILRDQGLNEEADRFAYRAQVLQRQVWRRQHRYLKYLGSWFLWLLAGHGYRPLRSVLWYLVIILGFALAYYTFGHLSLWPPDAFVYSLTSFHGRGFFPGLEGKPSLHDPLIMLAAFEAVIGLLIEISFIATFTQRFFGR